MSKIIKILCLSTNGILSDGITSWMKTTFSAMDLSGFEVTTTAFVGCSLDIVESVRQCGINVEIVPNRKSDTFNYMRAIRNLLKTGHYDIVHVCCNSATAAFEIIEAKRCGVAMRIAHSHNTMCTHRFANSLLGPFFQKGITDRFACGVDAGKWLFGSKQFTVIPNGKNLSQFSYSSKAREVVRGELGFSDDEPVFGHVGSFNKQKNHEKLLDIFIELYRRDSHSRLVLVGEGPMLSKIKKKVEHLGIENAVSFLGCRDDVPRLLNAMDCMIFPSLYEGFPNVVLEWQLNGLPVVMSDSITNECAITPFVFQIALDATASVWADSAESVLVTRNRAEDSISAQLAARSSGYDISEIAEKLRSLYLEGVNGFGM